MVIIYWLSTLGLFTNMYQTIYFIEILQYLLCTFLYVYWCKCRME